MEVSVEHYNEEGSAWNAFVVSHSGSTNYHLHGWREVIERSFGHRTYHLTARNNNNDICGLLRLAYIKSAFLCNSLISLLFFNYGSILCSNDELS